MIYHRISSLIVILIILPNFFLILPKNSWAGVAALADTQTSLAHTGQGKKFSPGDLISLSLFIFFSKLLINS